MRAAIQSQQGQAASGKAEEEPIVVLSATTTTPPEICGTRPRVPGSWEEARK
jgi:hypothetical protein